MALFWCNKCSHLREVSNSYIGKSVKCPKCKETSSIHDTTVFVENLFNKLLIQNKELKLLRKKSGNNPKFTTTDETDFIELIDIHNTTALTNQIQFEPVLKWFQQKNIKTDIDPDSVDTSGFFDEIALSIGDNFTVLSSIINTMKSAHLKSYNSAKIHLSKKSPQDIKIIKKFCQELYEYSFVARYSFLKKDQVIYLDLQKAQKIVNFFNGIWMEWLILIKLLNFFKEHKISYSCMRSINITFPDKCVNELDLFVIANGVPICIECKSGEFRPYISKYSKLRKKLKLDKSQLLMCVVGLDDKQTKGLSSTYDITFVNESNITEHLKRILLSS